MTTLIKSVSDVYDEYMASGDPRVTQWPLMSGPGPTLALVLAYVVFVKRVGPSWMEDRKPFQLRYPMFLYNAVLVLTNFYLILETIRVLLKPEHRWVCRIDDKKDPDALRLAELGWWFYFIKFIEFADTIFFVLRKKNKNISTLHVVHHAVVPIAVWGGLRIEPGSYNYFFPFINTIVHTVMYSYYGLAALGPSVQKYLWWKKYLTTFQMIQFVMVFFYVMTLMITNCQVSKFIIYLNTFLAGLFLIMFYDYFQNTYLKNRAIRKQRDIDNNLKNSSSSCSDGDVLNSSSCRDGTMLKNSKEGKVLQNGKSSDGNVLNSFSNGDVLKNGKDGNVFQNKSNDGDGGRAMLNGKSTGGL